MSKSVHSFRGHVILAAVFLLCLAVVGTCFAEPAGQTGAAQSASPSNVEDDTWLADWKALFAEDQLYLYAVKLYGSPVNCEGKVTDIYEDTRFGTIRLIFAEGSELLAESYPPESTRVILKTVQGFPDENEARSILKQYVGEKGHQIDWSKPEVEIADDGGARFLRYFDPDPGLNAAAILVYKAGRLVEMGYQMAL